MIRSLAGAVQSQPRTCLSLAVPFAAGGVAADMLTGERGCLRNSCQEGPQAIDARGNIGGEPPQPDRTRR